MTRKRVVLGIGMLVVAVIGIWALVAARTVDEARSDVDAAVESLRRGHPGSGGLLELVSAGRGSETEESATASAENSQAELQRAADQFARASSQLDSAVLAPARILPVVGRQLRATRVLTSSAATVSQESADALGELLDIADARDSSPAGRLQAVDATRATLDGLATQLAATDLGPEDGLFASVRDGREQFATELAELVASIEAARVAVAGVSSFLTGPTDYLVLAANNAEMRAGSGMILQVGTVEIDRGEFTLSNFMSSTDLLLDAPGAQLDPDIATNWGALLPNQEWRNLNLSPRFEETARMASEMWVAAGNAPVDGVMQLDVAAVRSLLELTGPVEVAGRNGSDPVTVDAESIAGILLRDQYAQYSEQDDRRELLGRVTSSVFDAFNTREIAAMDLLALIERNGSQRHMMLWSSVPEQEAAWQELGVTGAIAADSLLVSIINRGGTKLDPYIKVHSVLRSRVVGDMRELSITTTLTNEAPEGLPTYVQGPVPGSGGVAGEYVGILAVTAPESAVDPATSANGFAAVGPDGPSRLIASNVDVRRGEQVEVVTTFRVPMATEEIRVLPSTHLPRSTWTAGSTEWTEGRPHRVDLAELDG